MQPQIVTKPAFTVVGLRIRTTPMSPEIPTLWKQFVPRMKEIPHPAAEDVSYGLMGNYDQAQHKFDYMAGNPVQRVGNLPASMSAWEVPASMYVVVETTLPKLGEGFDYIYNKWLPSSGYQQTTGVTFERYGEEFSPNNPIVSIYVPIAKDPIAQS